MKRNAAAFNDLLLQANKPLSQDEEARIRYQDRFSHVLVDEYQDTNIAQYRFAKILWTDSPAGEKAVVFEAGDSSDEAQLVAD